jgi:xeroderma pigmentosum group C-complementing protein
MITKQRIPDPARRGRLFESTMMRLTDWWRDYFIIDPDMHIRSMTFEEAELNAADEQRGDVLKSAKSLMKHAMNKHGSRDTSAILFTALCRGLNIPARLVVSLQPVPWKAADNTSSKLQIKKPDIKGKGKAPQTPLESSDDDLEPVEVKVTSLKLSSKKRRVRKTPILSESYVNL